MDYNRYVKYSRFTVVAGFTIAFQANAQEVNYSDYINPSKNFIAIKRNQEDRQIYFSNTYGLTSTSGSLPPNVTGFSGFGASFSNWPPNNIGGNNGTVGFVIRPVEPSRTPEWVDIQFMYKADNGTPRRYRIDLIETAATTTVSVGTTANGGIAELTTANAWQRFFKRRKNDLVRSDGSYGRISQVKLVAIHNDENNLYPTVAETYNENAILVLDNPQVTYPKGLRGFFRVDAGNIYSHFFALDGLSQLSSAWNQNIGTPDLLNIFGVTPVSPFSYRTSSSISFTYLSSGIRQFSSGQLGDNLSGFGMVWNGSGQTGTASTDRFYAMAVDQIAPTASCVLRQINTTPLTHYFRGTVGASGGAVEYAVNLGGEPIVAVLDADGDGFDDIVTRSGSNFMIRFSNGLTGNAPNSNLNLLSAVTLAGNGFLKCLAVADMNGDGFEDMLVTDTVSGDVFSLKCSPSGGDLKWLFQLNFAQNEKILTLADADADGLPEIYSVRKRTSDGVGEVNIRKLNSAASATLVFGLVYEYNFDSYKPLAVGDLNGDGSCDVVLQEQGNGYNVTTALVNPVTRGIIGIPHWICAANTTAIRPIFEIGVQ